MMGAVGTKSDNKCIREGALCAGAARAAETRSAVLQALAAGVRLFL